MSKVLDENVEIFCKNYATTGCNAKGYVTVRLTPGI